MCLTKFEINYSTKSEQHKWAVEFPFYQLVFYKKNALQTKLSQESKWSNAKVVKVWRGPNWAKTYILLSKGFILFPEHAVVTWLLHQTIWTLVIIEHHKVFPSNGLFESNLNFNSGHHNSKFPGPFRFSVRYFR